MMSLKCGRPRKVFQLEFQGERESITIQGFKISRRGKCHDRHRNVGNEEGGRGELYLRRKPGAGWEASFYERVVNASTAVMDGLLCSERLADHYFRGQTFKSPDEAAVAVRRVVAA